MPIGTLISFFVQPLPSSQAGKPNPRKNHTGNPARQKKRTQPKKTGPVMFSWSLERPSKMPAKTFIHYRFATCVAKVCIFRIIHPDRHNCSAAQAFNRENFCYVKHKQILFIWRSAPLGHPKRNPKTINPVYRLLLKTGCHLLPTVTF